MPSTCFCFKDKLCDTVICRVASLNVLKQIFNTFLFMKNSCTEFSANGNSTGREGKGRWYFFGIGDGWLCFLLKVSVLNGLLNLRLFFLPEWDLCTHLHCNSSQKFIQSAFQPHIVEIGEMASITIQMRRECGNCTGLLGLIKVYLNESLWNMFFWFWRLNWRQRKF